jgi:hypothetical protein
MLEPLTIHLSKEPIEKGFERKEINGFIECSKSDSKIKDFLLEFKNFSVTFYTLYQEYQNHKLILKSFKDFCVKNENWISEFIGDSNFFFKIGVFDAPAFQSEQTDLFLELHKKWFYFEFDISYEEIYSIDEFRKNLEDRFIYQTCEDEWEKTKIFTQVLNVEIVKKIFDTIVVLSNIESVISSEITKRKEKIYKEMKSQWNTEIPIKIEIEFPREAK